MNSPKVKILHGNVIDMLRTISDGLVHCVVTSPPYWGLRDYSRCECAIMSHSGFQGLSGSELGQGVNARTPEPNCPKCHGTGKDESLTVVWDAKDGCEHEWGDEMEHGRRGNRGVSGTGGNLHPSLDAAGSGAGSGTSGSFCRLCGAWRGQLGLEPTPDLYVQHIVQAFQGVRRVLRDDGTLFLNMGDCYAGKSGGNVGVAKEWQRVGRGQTGETKQDIPEGLKQKDLVGMPWRVAFALQADGWYLRSDIIWAKPNPMPESVTDRPTKSHEYVFLLTKASRYFYDADAVRESQAESTTARERYHYPNPVDNPDYKSKHPEGDFRRFPIQGQKLNPKRNPKIAGEVRGADGGFGHEPGWRKTSPDIGSRNLRTVWTIPTQPYPESHFATFPEALVERCVKAGTSEKGCCAMCGMPWTRVLSESFGGTKGKSWTEGENTSVSGLSRTPNNPGENYGTYRRGNTSGWELNCRCHIGADSDGESAFGARNRVAGAELSQKDSSVAVASNRDGRSVRPCIVLDPFAGSGTVGAVARSLGRSALLVEIKEQYVELIKRRTDAGQAALGEFSDPDPDVVPVPSVLPASEPERWF